MVPETTRFDWVVYEERTEVIDFIVAGEASWTPLELPAWTGVDGGLARAGAGAVAGGADGETTRAGAISCRCSSVSSKQQEEQQQQKFKSFSTQRCLLAKPPRGRRLLEGVEGMWLPSSGPKLACYMQPWRDRWRRPPACSALKQLAISFGSLTILGSDGYKQHGRMELRASTRWRSRSPLIVRVSVPCLSSCERMTGAGSPSSQHGCGARLKDGIAGLGDTGQCVTYVDERAPERNAHASRARVSRWWWRGSCVLQAVRYAY